RWPVERGETRERALIDNSRTRLTTTLPLRRTRKGPETAAQANNSERRVATVSREIASRAPEVAAGRHWSKTCGLHRQAAAEPGPRRGHPRWGGDAYFPRRLACSRRSGFWPDQSNV